MTNKTLRVSLFTTFSTFFEFEFAYLHKLNKLPSTETDLRHLMIQANMVDSEQFKVHRRTSYSKLCATIELLSKGNSLNKLGGELSFKLIELLTQLLNSADSHLQQIVLTCLVKASKKVDFENTTLKLPKYQKLLEGLTDDTKYKDMIPIIVFGSQEGATESL